MAKVLLMVVALLSVHAFAMEKADLVVVEKAKKALYLEREGKILKKYHIALGPHPKGPKQSEGDGRTPEGRYVLDFKKSDSAYYKSIHISYPNDFDTDSALAKGLSPGGSVMIHGQKNGYEKLTAVTQRFNWTQGCLALTDQDMDEVWDAIDVGTPIEIRP